MTVDIQAAAEREAEERYVGNPEDRVLGLAFAELRREGFIAGAVWAQARLTPTREQIAAAIEEKLHGFPDRTFDASRPYGIQEAEWAADAVLGLLHS